MYNHFKTLIRITIASCLSFVLCTNVSLAQSAIEEITVTATKRATSLQDTAASVQAIDSETLSLSGIDDVLDLFRRVPGLSLTDAGPGDKRFAIRGLQLPGEAQVGLYLDEMPLVGSPSETDDAGGSQPELIYYDLERIEVLKGPQGTLYGAGSQGGTVRVLTKKPNHEKFDADIQTSFADTKDGGFGFNVNGMVNVPLVNDTLSFRGVVSYRDEDGYIDDLAHNRNNANDVEYIGTRLQLLFEPNEDLSILAAANLSYIESGNSFEYDFAETRRQGRPVSIEATATPWDDDFEAFSLTVNYEGLSFADFSGSVSYSSRDVNRNLDFTDFSLAVQVGSACTVLDLINSTCGEAAVVAALVGADGNIRGVNSYGQEKVDALSFEARISDKSDGRLHWLAGVFYQDRDTTRSGQVGLTGTDGRPIFDANGVFVSRLNTATVAISNDGPAFGRDNEFDYSQIAVFGELSYDLTEQLTATFGLRWFENEKRNQEAFTFLPAFPPAIGPRGAEEFKEDNVVQKWNLSYALTDNHLLYFQAAEGVRIGGPNRPAPGAARDPFESDKLWNYELGWRTAWFDNCLIFNGSMYYIEWEDIQVDKRVNSTVGGVTRPFQGVGNGETADIVGVELEFLARPADNFQMGLNVNYNDAQLTADIPNPGPGDEGFDGDNFPNIPKTSVNTNATYFFPVANMEGYVTGDWSYVSGMPSAFSPVTRRFFESASYHLVNLRAGMSSETWRAALFVNNVFDEITETSIRLDNGVPRKATTAPPRTIGVEVGYSFN